MDLFRFNTLRGLIGEAVAWSTLRQTYPLSTLRMAHSVENIEQDIDLWVDGVPVSIKTQHKGVETGNYSFELEQQLRSGKWVKDHGFWCSKAQTYLIIQGDHMYRLSKASVCEYVKKHGWDRVVTLSQSFKEGQEGKYHIDAKSGLIARDKLSNVVTYHIDPLLLKVADDLTIACEHIDTALLRDSRLVSQVIDVLVTCYSGQPHPIARQSLVKYAMNVLTLSRN